MKLSDVTKKSAKLRVQYLSLIGHMARIDGKFDDKENSLLTKMVSKFGIPEKQADKVFEIQTFSDDQIKSIFNDLKKSQLHYSFILDLIIMAHADGVIMDQERLMLSEISRLIGLKHEEFHNLINFVQATSNLNDDNHNDPMYQYVIEMFFQWARQKDVKLYKQTTFALNDKVDSILKQVL